MMLFIIQLWSRNFWFRI